MIVTWSSNSNQDNLQCDPEIERTMHRLRRDAQRNHEENNPFPNNYDLEHEEVMVVIWTFKELAAPDLNQQPLWKTFPALDVITFELKSGIYISCPLFMALQMKIFINI